MLDTKLISLLRSQTGAPINDCQKALEESGGDMEKAVIYLRKRGEKKLLAKQDRTTGEGIIESYIHAGGRVGVLVELRCETDFVARNEVFKNLAHDVALHIAARNPQYLSPEDISEELLSTEKEIYRAQLLTEGKTEEMVEKIFPGKLEKFYEETCLLKQCFVKDDTKKIEDLLSLAVTSLGENIRIARFIRFSL